MLFSPVSEGYKMLQGPLVMTTVCSSNLHFNDKLTQSIVYSVITAISQLLVLVLDTDTKTRVAIKVMCVCVSVPSLDIMNSMSMIADVRRQKLFTQTNISSHRCCR